MPTIFGRVDCDARAVFLRALARVTRRIRGSIGGYFFSLKRSAASTELPSCFHWISACFKMMACF